MSVRLDVRNPDDLTTSFNQVQIQRSTDNDATTMTDLATVSIDTTTASDLSTGSTSYIDESGDINLHWYRFRYKNSVSGALSSYSDIFKAGGTVLHARFRRMMRDVNSNNYFFSDDDIDFFLEQAIANLWPITWMETVSDEAFVADGETEIFNFPVGVTRVNSIDFIDSNGENLGSKINWRVRGKMILFDSPPSTGTTLRAWIEKMFTKLAEVPSIWDSHLLNRMRLQAYEMMEGDRNKYYKYNSIAKPEGGNLPSLDRIITRIETQIKLRESQIRRVRRPASIKLV